MMNSSTVHITCNKDDYVCYFILIFGLFLFMIAIGVIIKFAYDSTKRQRGTHPHITNEQSRRVFQVVLNMMNENGIQINGNDASRRNQAPLYPPITPQPLNNSSNAASQRYSCPLPPTYEECMTFGTVHQNEPVECNATRKL